MDEKLQVILRLLGELHEFCEENNIFYCLADAGKTPYTASVKMDPQKILRFVREFMPADSRAVEWMGNNHRYIGDTVKYIDLNTTYVNENRLLREVHLGMYITIIPAAPSGGRLKKLDRYRKHLGYSATDDRSAILNGITGVMFNSMLKAGKASLKAKDIVTVDICSIKINVPRGSGFADDPEGAFISMIRRKPNSDSFFCDADMSYRDIDFSEDRKVLADYNREIRKARISYKNSEHLQGDLVHIANASYYRFCVATDILMKYSYDEMIELANDPAVRDSLELYMKRAKTIRRKRGSLYIGDEFTKVINTVYPDVDTDDLYKFTPEIYREGIRVCDYKGDLTGIYGGAYEQ